MLLLLGCLSPDPSTVSHQIMSPCESGTYPSLTQKRAEYGAGREIACSASDSTQHARKLCAIPGMGCGQKGWLWSTEHREHVVGGV